MASSIIREERNEGEARRGKGDALKRAPTRWGRRIADDLAGILRYAQDDNSVVAVRVRTTELEGFGEQGFGVKVLLFQVRVEEHGGVADEDAA